MTKQVEFEFFAGRLSFIEISDDPRENIDLYHYLTELENYAYGVFLQYSRILDDLKVPSLSEGGPSTSSPNGKLDIYFYTMTWDKLRKITELLVEFMNGLHKQGRPIPRPFTKDFRFWKKRMQHLLSEFDIDVRNEYEHPSLEPDIHRNILSWGTILVDGAGNVKAHVGKKHHAVIKHEHPGRLRQLLVDLVDLFLEHFSQKPLTKELMKVRDYIQKNLDSIIQEMRESVAQSNVDLTNQLRGRLVSHEMLLSREGVPLSREVHRRLYEFDIEPIAKGKH